MTRLGGYELLRSLGSGAMGEVFLARHDFLDVLRAVKVPVGDLASSPGFDRRFLDEGRMLNRLDHPNIVRVHDLGREGDTLYLAMDFVSPDGETSQSLDKVLADRGGRLPWRETTRIMAQVCRAVAYAHGRRIIHRDIKPANVLMDRDGVVKVSDFGLATMAGDDFMRQSIVASMGSSLGMGRTHGPGGGPGGGAERSLGMEDSRGSSRSSGAEGLVGTFHFMPPEVQARGVWTEQGDIYSLGVLAYVLLVGKYPVGRFRLPHEADAEIPVLWDTVIQKAMEDEPHSRYERVEDFLDALCVIDPELGMEDASEPQALGEPGEVPSTAVRMVREYVNARKGRHEKDQDYTRFAIAFYRTPGHDPVSEEQLESLIKEECRAWKERESRRLELEARQAEERRRAADEAESRRKAADEARRQLEREREAQRLAGEARAAEEQGRYGEARELWGRVLKLAPHENNAQVSLDRVIRLEADELGRTGQEAYDAYDYEEAVRQWDVALGLAPNNEELKKRRNEASLRLKTIEDLLVQSRDTIFQDNADIIENCSEVLRLCPRHPEATALKREAENSINKIAELKKKAEAFASKRNLREALTLLREAQRLNQNDRTIASRIRELQTQFDRQMQKEEKFTELQNTFIEAIGRGMLGIILGGIIGAVLGFILAIILILPLGFICILLYNDASKSEIIFDYIPVGLALICGVVLGLLGFFNTLSAKKE